MSTEPGPGPLDSRAPQASPGYTVKQVAALAGLPPATVRMWERRYAVVSPARSASGYRVYDDAAVRRLTAMRALVDGGCPPREAAVRVASGTTLGPTSTAPAVRGADATRGSLAADATGASDVTLESATLAAAARALDPGALDRLLDGAFGVAPFEEVVDHWLLPQLALLGTAWRTGAVSVGGEHFVSAAVQRRIAAAFEAAAVPPGAPRVLVGLARGSRHELGVLAFSAALRRAGVDVVFVGADVPPESWVVLVSGSPVAAVVLGVPTADDEPAARETLAALAAAYPRLPLCVGGASQDALGDLATPLGHRLADAVHELTATLPPVS